jgi:RimJ/RimL family protein N-acetyltransferase
VNIPPIEGHGVRLREFRDDDLDVVLEGFNDPLTQRYMTALPEPFAVREGEWWISEGAPAKFANGGSSYAIADPVTDRLLGGIGLDNVISGRGQAEIGYWVAPSARRRGTATRAVRALSEHAFGTGLTRLELITHWENAASQRVAMAAGFERESARRGLLRNRAGGHDDGLAFVRLAGDAGQPVERMLPDLPGGELTDGVVTLRPLVPGDVVFATELHNVPDVIATSVPPEAKSADQIRRRCEYAEAHWLYGDRADLVVVDAATGTPAGDLGLFYTEPQLQQAMIGYSMLPAWRGRGYVTRAVELLALWAFAETAVARLIAGVFPDNHGSQRVLSKAGFKREAYMRSRLPGVHSRLDDLQFVLLAEDLLTEGVHLDG